eukprot:TRINITY_DN12249_c0_g1_i2.p1 TRINITY_DN12249_c0_g1~~TRINITY_DN12249_c0_g1_i2.p1  ORF type:complete len:1651 (-),score=296.99 TRINITY_DN12249_c0_g1_i2:326-5278(-)
MQPPARPGEAFDSLQQVADAPAAVQLPNQPDSPAPAGANTTYQSNEEDAGVVSPPAESGPVPALNSVPEENKIVAPEPDKVEDKKEAEANLVRPFAHSAACRWEMYGVLSVAAVVLLLYITSIALSAGMYYNAFLTNERRDLQSLAQYASAALGALPQNSSVRASSDDTAAVNSTSLQLARSAVHSASFASLSGSYELFMGQRSSAGDVSLLTQVKFQADCGQSCATENLRRFLAGRAGSYAGADYRGEEVLAGFAYSDSIAASLAVKGDRFEVTDEMVNWVQLDLLITAIIYGVLILLLGIGVTFFLRRLSRATREEVAADSRGDEAGAHNASRRSHVTHLKLNGFLVFFILAALLILTGTSLGMMERATHEAKTRYLLRSARVLADLCAPVAAGAGISPAAVVDKLNRITQQGNEEVLVISKGSGSKISILSTAKYSDQCDDPKCPWTSETVANALAGANSEVVVAKDYRGTRVNMAIAPLDGAAGTWLAFKSDVRDLRRPYFTARYVTIGVVLAASIVGCFAAISVVDLVLAKLLFFWRNSPPDGAYAADGVIAKAVAITLVSAVISAIAVACLIAGMAHRQQLHFQRQHLLMRAEMAVQAIEATYNLTRAHTGLAASASEAVVQLVNALNARRTIGNDEAVLVTGSASGPPKILSDFILSRQCPKGSCTGQLNATLLSALNRYQGSTVTHDYRDVKVTAAYSYSPLAGVGIVLKTDYNLLYRPLRKVVKDLCLGVGMFLAAACVSFILCISSGITHMGPKWADKSRQDPKTMQNDGKRKWLYLGGVIVTWVLLMLAVLVLLFVHTYRHGDDQFRDQLADSSRFVASLLPLVPQDATTLKALIESINWQATPPQFEVAIGVTSGSGVAYLASQKYPAACTEAPDTCQKWVQPMKLAVQGKTGVGSGVDYRDEDVLAAWSPVSDLQLGLVLQATHRSVYLLVRNNVKMTSWVAVVIFLVGCTISIVSAIVLFDKLEWRLRFPLLPPPASPVAARFGVAMGLLIAVFIILLFAVWGFTVGKSYMAGKTQIERNLLSTARLARGVLEYSAQSHNTADPTDVISWANFMALMGDTELVLGTSQANATSGYGYLTPLKYRALCDDVDCTREKDEPMVEALKRQTGIHTGDSYTGERFLSAYTYHRSSGVGIVVQSDLSEFREDYRVNIEQTVWFCAGLAVLGLLLVVLIMRWATAALQAEIDRITEVAATIAERVALMQQDDVAIPDRGSLPVLPALRSIWESYKAYRPFLPDTLSPGVEDTPLMGRGPSNIPPGTGSVPMPNDAGLPSPPVADLAAAVESASSVDVAKTGPLASMLVNPSTTPRSMARTEASRSSHGTFRSFVPPESPQAFVELGLSHKHVAVMVLRFFNLDAIRTTFGVEVVNLIHAQAAAEVVRTVRSNGGTFHGWSADKAACICSWNTVSKCTAHREKACAAALALTEQLRALVPQWRQRSQVKAKYGIALLSGHLSVGNMGCDLHKSYGLLGPAMALADPFVLLNQPLKTHVLMNDDMYQTVMYNFVSRPVDIVDLGRFVAGQERAVAYELLRHKDKVGQEWMYALDEEACDDFTRPFVSAFEALVPGSSVDTAVGHIARHLATHKDDKTAQVIKTHLAAMKTFQPRQFAWGWAGTGAHRSGKHTPTAGEGTPVANN